MRVRVVVLAGAIAAACFDAPPSVGPTEEGTSASTTTAGSSGGTGNGETAGSTSIDPDGSSGDPTGSTGFCPAPQLFAYAPVTAASGSTFDTVGPAGGGLWVLGTHTPDATSSPAAWPIEGDGIGARVLGPLSPVELSAYVPGPQPLAVYYQTDARAVVLDDPAVGGLVEIGAWDAPNANGFRDVVRDPVGVLWGAGFVNDDNGSAYWQVARSDDNGAGWVPEQLAYAIAGRPASAHAIEVGPRATLVVAGQAEADDGKPRWITFVFPAGQSAGEPVDDRPGSAYAVVVAGTRALVGGASPGGGAIRMATLPDGEFEEVALFDRPIRDLALTPSGVVLALGALADGTEGWSLWACHDPALGQDCWTPLVEAVDVEPPGHAHASRMFVDQDVVWVPTTIRYDGGAPPAGQLYRVDCSG